MTNKTGIDIPFTRGGNASSIEVFLPISFDLAEINQAQIVLNNWTFKIDQERISLLLTYTGNDGTSWPNGGVMKFEITGIKTDDSPGADTIQFNLGNFPEEAPTQVSAPLSISNPPKDGNGDLTKVLQVFLDNQGSVLVSPKDDPLQNSVFLNVKNIDDTPLYKGSGQWKSDPMVSVVFVYGQTIGSLAPDDKRNNEEGSGSAWNIKGKIPYESLENKWGVNPPTDNLHPKWQFKPSKNNPGIIGVDQNATITFRFDQIISFTPPGHTQMVVHFSGFMLDEDTPYDDAVFVLDMVKQNAPATRGLVHFFSPDPILNTYQPDTPIAIPLKWTMFNVAKVNLLTTYPGIEPIVIDYPNPPAVNYDEKTISLPGITRSTGFHVTLQAFNGTGGLLNSLQFMVSVKANMFVDPRDTEVYPVVKVNNRIWMAANLRFKSEDSHLNGKLDEYGRLYEWKKAQPGNTPDGWRLPNQADWEDLTNTFSYDQLLAGGESGFNLQLNGRKNDDGRTADYGKYGYYWTSVERNGKSDYVIFSGRSKTINYTSGRRALPIKYALSVRYVKDVS
jgi:uncharacterized protein (TIGR02145 family)